MILKNISLFESFLNEVHNVQTYNLIGATNRDSAMEMAQKLIDNSNYPEDLPNWIKPKWIGEVNDDRFDRLATDGEGNYAVVGSIDGDFYLEYGYRS